MSTELESRSIASLAEAPLSLTPSLRALVTIHSAGVVCTALAMSLYFVVARRVGTSRSSLVPLFMTVVAVMLGAAVLDERLALEAWLGMALILAGARAVRFTNRARPTPTRPRVARPTKK